MYKNRKICVIIPYYNAAKHITEVINGIPGFTDQIIVVDDNSPEALPEAISRNEKVHVIHNEINKGVGGAVTEGFRHALDSDCDIVVKMDADGQMDPAYLPPLLDALIERDFGFAKGNRFHDLEALKKMPFVRRTGNLVLSFLVKAATGYWNNFDPTNGYFAIKKEVLQQINLNNLSPRYFFETSLLAELYYHQTPIADIPMPAIYGDEKSNMKVWKMPFEFLPKLLKAIWKRIYITYYLYDFNMASVYMFFGIPLFLFGLVFGSYKWWYYASRHVPAPTGTVMIAVLSVILGFQLILQAIQYDIQRAPKSKP
ncbi:MAG: glycosyltransferase family 2 protein [Chlorobi bacterium]|nr:glycosyltransferase family 2 protein [Chlorobiota bacterium]